jgi:hypothetical protein
MKNISWMAAGVVAGLLAVNVLVTGCESTSSQEEVIKLTPVAATLSGGTPTVTFFAYAASTNTPLVLPLEWSVARSDLGRILNASGVSAVYESSGRVGNNTITVEDQVGQSGVASIEQLAPGQTNTVSFTPYPTPP